MPTKRVIKQKQKQKQTTIVNINVAKAKSRAKKSGKKGGRGSALVLPPPIYVSPIDRLTPAMYGAQGQQIQQQSLDQMLKAFLSNQQNQQVGSFKTLGRAPDELKSTSEFIPYDESRATSFKSLGSLSSTNATANSLSSSNSLTDYGSLGSWSNINSDSSRGTSTTSRYPILSSVGSSYPDNVSEMTDPTYMSEFSKPMSTESQYDRALASPFTSDIPIPFQNEEHSYLKASEPDYEKNAPKFTDTPPESITEIIRRPERRKPVRIELDEESISNQGTPASKVNVIPFEDEMSSDSLSNYSSDSLNTNPFPKNMYNKMLGFN